MKSLLKGVICTWKERGIVYTSRERTTGRKVRQTMTRAQAVWVVFVTKPYALRLPDFVRRIELGLLHLDHRQVPVLGQLLNTGRQKASLHSSSLANKSKFNRRQWSIQLLTEPEDGERDLPLPFLGPVSALRPRVGSIDHASFGCRSRGDSQARVRFRQRNAMFSTSGSDSCAYRNRL